MSLTLRLLTTMPLNVALTILMSFVMKWNVLETLGNYSKLIRKKLKMR